MAIRAEGLRTNPWSFAGAPGDDRFEDRAATIAHLADARNAVFAAEDDASRLLAVAGVMCSGRVKHAHRASIWGVYATPAVRGRGLGRAVVGACIEYAHTLPGVTRVALSVSERSVAARRLYESLGFVAWGTEPAATKIGEESAAEIHMQLVLR
jgi:ribosomal protein S18 acetylase RimI-like enzyme